MPVTIAHVVFGTAVLLLGPAALLLRGRLGLHRRLGIAFVVAMAVVILTAGFMWQKPHHLFLLFLDAIAAYLVFYGYRSLRRTQESHSRRARALDLTVWVLLVLDSAAVVWIAAAGSTAIVRDIGLVLFALGAIGFVFAAFDLKGLATGWSRRRRLSNHFTGMIAAYVSAVTAFCVINFHGVPMFLRWFVPSAIGTLVISRLTYEHLFARRRDVQRVSTSSTAR
jgi:threonine/homoserine/homoserine lactone efflux protein